MDAILNSAGYEADSAPQPADTQAPANTPNLGQSEQQAPAPTSGGLEGGDRVSDENQRTVSYEEYEKLKQQFEEKDGIVSRLKEMTEENIAKEQWNSYKNERASQIKSVIEQSNGDDEQLYAAIHAILDGTLDGVRDDFNQKFTEYQNKIQGWASDFEWQNTREQEADRLIQTRGLNPAIKQKLLEAPTRESMTERADTAKYLTDLTLASGVNRAIQDQEAQRRNSGVDNIGIGGGPVPQEPLKPGNADEPHLRAALKNALGIG